MSDKALGKRLDNKATSNQTVLNTPHYVQDFIVAKSPVSVIVHVTNISTSKWAQKNRSYKPPKRSMFVLPRY